MSGWIQAAMQQNTITDMGGKSKFSAHESDLAPFVGNGTKFKITSEIKPPLIN